MANLFLWPFTETQEIEVGSVYEIDHTKLPPRTPVQLKCIRVVMVSEKTELNVSVRFPSIESLQRYFSNRTREMYPELDERFVMGTTLAEKVLFRKIPSQEFAEKKQSNEFWLEICNSVSGFGDVISRKSGTCVSELKCNGMIRWGVRRQVRYKLAERNLLEVMKSKGAVFGSPILRPELRAEARKRIGDTGLLDHLLKHMAGKVAPGGSDRFRRRHNAEGAMEYWLESADLVDIRREAGVQDPYWTPPPGWKQGDCPTQDPICAMELKQLKKETTKLERDMEEMVSKKQMDEELAKLRREMLELLSIKQNEESQAIVVSNPSATSQNLDLDTSLLVPFKSDLDSSFITLEKYKEQLMVISEYVSRIEEEIKKLKSKVGEEETKLDSSALMVATECCTEKEKKKVGENGKQQEVGTEGADNQSKTNTAAERTAAEQKAAKIQRLKSGFRICKPQGTFLWPNMASNNNKNSNANTSMLSSSQVVVQVEDLLVVPTPPSVSSSTASAPPQLPFHRHHHHHPSSPVKPLAERRAVTVTVSAIGNPNVSTTTTTTTTTTSTITNKTSSTLLNLNDFPTTNPGDGFCGTPSTRQTVNNTTLTPSKVEGEMGRPWEVVGGKSSGKRTESNQQQQEEGGSSSTSAASTTCLPKGVGTWLALATPTPALDDSTRG
ncbi:protein DYAD-like [Camellia sinensis]|uniref:protein DYAD-like n=1 Tax=Camellia sinensis TaxID=4442 RepID=UPI0010359BA4|nr:protein DYAD-like [Camellia sinensis]